MHFRFRKMSLAVAFVGSLEPALMTFAATPNHVESTPAVANGNPIIDAGSTIATAEVITGSGPLNSITGNFNFGGDQDLYKFSITNPTAFSATASGTRLFLFNNVGNGIAFNQSTSGSATLTSQFILSAGTYVLGVASLNSNARDGANVTDANGLMGNQIFNTTISDQQVPPNAGVGPLANFVQSGISFGGAYTVALTGSGGVVPEPATASAAVAATALVFRRRRRS